LQTLHRDLKPSNILISASGHVCLADFGFAYTFPEKKNRKFSTRKVYREVVGTPEYYAPELLQGCNAEYSSKGEVWDYGLIILEMFIATGDVCPDFLSDRRF
jgi:serine/threonine protein kinase